MEVIFISRFFSSFLSPEQMELIIEKFLGMLFFFLDAIITSLVQAACLFLISKTRTDYLIMIYVVTFRVNRFDQALTIEIYCFRCFHLILLTNFENRRFSAFSLIWVADVSSNFFW